MSWLDGLSAGLTAATQGAGGYLEGQAKGRKEQEAKALAAAQLLRQQHLDEQNALLQNAQIGNYQSEAAYRASEPARSEAITARQEALAKAAAEAADKRQAAMLAASDGRQQTGLAAQIAAADRLANKPQRVQVDDGKGGVKWAWLRPGEEAPVASKGSGGTLGVGNAVQSRSLGFARRMIDADRIMRAHENSGKPTVGVQVAKSLPFVGAPAGEFVSSGDQQKYDVAKTDYESAQMRQESGAAINADEWKQADKRYARQLFNKPGTIEQKRQARIMSAKAMMKAAGNAASPEDRAIFAAYLKEVGDPEADSFLAGGGGAVPDSRTATQRDWDDAVKLHGKDRVLKEFGPRPEGR